MNLDTSQDIRSLAEGYLTRVSRGAGDNISAICPFHVRADGRPERSPSFTMNVHTGLWQCWACHSKGNLYTFLRDLGVGRDIIQLRYKTLLDAVKDNAPPPPDPLRPKALDHIPIDEGLLGLFEWWPVEYLQKGFHEHTLRHFDIGVDSWNKRITFPLRDLLGNLVGVSGRATEDWQTPRFKIYDGEYVEWGLPARYGWNKGAVLYHAHNVYPHVFWHNPDSELVIVVEGFKACMWVWQCGFRNVVALMGSSMSFDHRWILERMGCSVVVWLDNDKAGRKGTFQLGYKLSTSRSVLVCEYPSTHSRDSNASPDDLSIVDVHAQLGSVIPFNDWLRQQPEHHQWLQEEHEYAQRKARFANKEAP